MPTNVDEKNPFEDDKEYANPFEDYEETALTESTTDIWDDAVIEINGVPVTTSLKIAEIFGKAHKNVLQRIREEQAECKKDGLNFQPMSTCSVQSFIPATYRDSYDHDKPMYYLTRTGLSFIIMGFTGSKAREWKWKYIAKFEEMEKQLKQKTQISVKTDPQISKAILMLTERVISADQKIEDHGHQISDISNKVKTLENRIEELSQPKEEISNPIEDIIALKNYILDRYENKMVSGIRVKDHQDAYRVIYNFLRKFGINPYQLRDELKAKKISEGVPRTEVATYSTITAIKYNPDIWPRVNTLITKLWDFARR